VTAYGQYWAYDLIEVWILHQSVRNPNKKLSQVAVAEVALLQFANVSRNEIVE
jgi:hypothetical protein